MSRYDNEESGEYPALPRRRKDVVGDWLTWGVRAFIPLIAWLAWQQMVATQTVEITMAKISMQQDYQTKQLDDHAKQLQRIWRQLPQQMQRDP